MPLSCVLVIIEGHSQKPLAADITTTYLHKSSKRALCSCIPSVTKSQADLDISQVSYSMANLLVVSLGPLCLDSLCVRNIHLLAYQQVFARVETLHISSTHLIPARKSVPLNPNRPLQPNLSWHNIVSIV